MTALESEVRDLSARVRASEHDAAAARVLAGGADRDVNEIRAEIRDFRQATVSSFNAVREDLHDVRQRFDAVDQRFDAVDRSFIEMRGKLDAAAAGQEQIVGLLNTLIEGQDEQPEPEP
ncbi:MAG: hypothetical protein GEV00_16695 [Actinophytocola sp.]|nr:hypothetical protein [Actinophytocola sp.]